MLAKINSAAVVGLDAVPIDVEVDIASGGLPSFTIVGLPDKAVEEAREKAYEIASKIVVPKMFYRTDIGIKFIKEDQANLKKWGWI